MLWKQVLSVLETVSTTPKPYGVFHLVWLIATVFVIILLCFVKKKDSEKQLKCILAIYAIGAFILEALKQLIWSVDYDNVLNVFVWDFQWYAFPFQLCTMPIYICLICIFLNKIK